LRHKILHHLQPWVKRGEAKGVREKKKIKKQRKPTDTSRLQPPSARILPKQDSLADSVRAGSSVADVRLANPRMDLSARGSVVQNVDVNRRGRRGRDVWTALAGAGTRRNQPQTSPIPQNKKAGQLGLNYHSGGWGKNKRNRGRKDGRRILRERSPPPCASLHSAHTDRLDTLHAGPTRLPIL
jgi:hypothetical protein